MSDRGHDGIVLGAGHNALVLQAYLCRAGLRVLSLERSEAPGGGQRTVENPRHPGFLHNTHSFFHRAVTAMPWYRDLELERHGARYIEPARNVVLLLDDGRSIEWWTDLERTVETFARFSRRDAETLRHWVDEFEPIVERLIRPEAESAPLSPARRRELLERSPAGRRLLEVSALSPLEFVEREFEDDTVRAGLLFFNGLREVDLRLRGFGHAIPALLASRHKAQMCAGGSARLADALVSDICEHGGEVRCGVEPRSILTRGDRAVGVELVGGERLEATSFVASGLNPQQTFVDLLDADRAAGGVHETLREFRRRAAKFRYNLIAPLFALNVALDAPPVYPSLEGSEPPFMVILGLEGLGGFREIVAAHEAGEIPPTVAWGASPTLFDPSQAPPGKHTAFLWEKVPYALRGDPRRWEEEKPRHERALLDFWSRHAPNLSSAVIDAFSLSPVDTETSFPNMRRGDLLVGSFAGGQVGYHRPFPGAGEYRGGLAGLYLCGGSTHPGGNTTGLCGYNAASVIARDLGLDPWWNPVPVEERWREV